MSKLQRIYNMLVSIRPWFIGFWFAAILQGGSCLAFTGQDVSESLPQASYRIFVKATDQVKAASRAPAIYSHLSDDRYQLTLKAVEYAKQYWERKVSHRLWDFPASHVVDFIVQWSYHVDSDHLAYTSSNQVVPNKKYIYLNLAHPHLKTTQNQKTFMDNLTLVLAHEIGHAFGWDHNQLLNSVMSERIPTVSP